MHRPELDHLLEKAVADALGVRLSPRRRAHTPRPRHAAKVAKRVRHVARELHPA